jgi:predicted LPLAT superfamily acyltransferase
VPVFHTSGFLSARDSCLQHNYEGPQNYQYDNPWQNSKERSTPFTLLTIRWIALHLGRPIARLLLYPITLYFLLFANSQRKASQQYLARALKRKVSWLDSAKHIHAFASTILDRVYLLTGQFEKLEIQFPAENIPLSYSRNGVGCLLLGSHIGSFEVLIGYSSRRAIGRPRCKAIQRIVSKVNGVLRSLLFCQGLLMFSPW